MKTLLLTLCLIAFAAPVFAQDDFVELETGMDSIVDSVWESEASLLAIGTRGEEFVVMRVFVTDGNVAELVLPSQFTRIKNDEDRYAALEFKIAPNGGAIAAFKDFGDPLRQNDLSVFRIDSGELRWLTTRSIPASFWIGDFCWNDDGTQIYLSAAPYVSPEQKYSLGVYEIEGKTFEGMTQKDKLDLIDSLEFLPKRNALAMKCRSLMGDYPDAAMLCILNLQTGKLNVLHSDATGIELKVSDDGTLIAYADIGLLSPDSDPWILQVGNNELKPLHSEFADSLESFASSADGRFAAFIQAADSGSVLYVQDTASLEVWSAACKAAKAEFSPASSHIAVYGDKGIISVFNLR